MTIQLDRIRVAANAGAAALAEILAALDEGQEPGELAPPSGFTATWDQATRTVWCRWDAQTDAVEVHERDTDPTATLKATLLPGTTGRQSSPLRGGHTYTWAARTVRGGEVSAFTEWITLDVPTEGGEEPEDPDEEPGGEDPAPGGPHPSDVIPLLAEWTIMLPTGSPGDPDNEYVVGRSIAGTYFVRDDPEHGLGVVFRTHPGTANHSPNSKYGRTEGRQMEPPTGSWKKSSRSSSDPQTMRARLSIDASRLAHPIVNALQIHDGGDDVMQVQSRDGVLGVAHDDGDSWEVIDSTYGLAGAVCDLAVTVTGRGEIVVGYNGREAVRIPKSGSGWYFKAGDYPNTGGANKDRVEDPAAFAEVVFYELEVVPA